jgi:hypothetical protein
MTTHPITLIGPGTHHGDRRFEYRGVTVTHTHWNRPTHKPRQWVFHLRTLTDGACSCSAGAAAFTTRKNALASIDDYLDNARTTVERGVIVCDYRN